jgi:hypothetical protein
MEAKTWAASWPSTFTNLVTSLKKRISCNKRNEIIRDASSSFVLPVVEEKGAEARAGKGYSAKQVINATHRQLLVERGLKSYASNPGLS